MPNKLIMVLKATVIDVIVAFMFVIILISIVQVILGDKINMAISLANNISIGEKNHNEKEINFIKEENKLKNYPSYGSKYATINIEAINIELPVYFGDTLEILKKGVGHSSGSYFPGESGSIIYMAHNSMDRFRKFSMLQKNDLIKVTTTYGEFNYRIYDMKIIKETDLEQLPIQNEKEILMVYTCYPFNNIGYTDQRYVVYANLEK